LGHEYVTEPTNKIDKRAWSKYDIIFPQGIVDLSVLVSLIEMKKEYGTKIVTDFDDMMVVGKDNPHYKEHQVLDAVNILTSFSKHCDLLTTTNEYLAKQLRKLNPNVKIVPNYIDLDYWQLPIQRNNDRVRIGYVGSITHMKDIQMIVPALKKILKKYKDKVELILVGDYRWRDLFKNFTNVEVILGIPFDNYASRLNGLRLDIGIAPLRDNEFCLSKSHIKWYENTIAGAVTIASPTVYDRVIRHGENGFIAKNTEEWIKYLSLMIEDSTLRENVWHRAYDEVTGSYSLEKHAHEWEQVYESVLK
jgi:O-antigen biosynthesis protein